jgi:hypothetical protein
LAREDYWFDTEPSDPEENSHHRVLDVYMRMLAECRRIMDGRGRGFSRMNYFLSLDELQQTGKASIHPSNRTPQG